ncbi:MAG: hydrogenase maturation nickel metallochaperone HypA [Candidatus Saccharibacteria bacterium]
MHELSLVEGVIDTVRASAIENNIHKVKKVKLVVGKLSMALPESLKFAFEVLCQDELFQGAVLEIEERVIRCRCDGCGHEYDVNDNYSFECPRCTEGRVEIVSGRELYIDYYEGEDT